MDGKSGNYMVLYSLWYWKNEEGALNEDVVVAALKGLQFFGAIFDVGLLFHR